MTSDVPKIVWNGEPPPEDQVDPGVGVKIGSEAGGQDDRPADLASPQAVPRAKRRLELRCDQEDRQPWPLLAVLGAEHLVTDLYALPYPAADDDSFEINCMSCQTRWEITIGDVRQRAEARTGLEVVPMSKIGKILPWQG